MSVATDHDCLYDRKALEEIFELCDLDDNGTMSKDEFNWFNLRTSGEELGDDEWQVVEGRKCWLTWCLYHHCFPFTIQDF